MPLPLPRRSTDLHDRAPVLVDQSTENRGHALVVAGLPELARTVRRRLAALTHTLPDEVTGTLTELASELFSNALRHSRSGSADGVVTVALNWLPGRVQVKVIDQGPRKGEIGCPHVRQVDLDREGGLGLVLVADQARQWGFFQEKERTTVWFDLDQTVGRE